MEAPSNVDPTSRATPSADPPRPPPRLDPFRKPQPHPLMRLGEGFALRRAVSDGACEQHEVGAAVADRLERRKVAVGVVQHGVQRVHLRHVIGVEGRVPRLVRRGDHGVDQALLGAEALGRETAAVARRLAYGVEGRRPHPALRHHRQGRGE